MKVGTQIFGAIAIAICSHAVTAQEVQEIGPPTSMTDSTNTLSLDTESFEKTAAMTDRASFTAPKQTRGTTVPIPIGVIERFCSDIDGCEVRIGMHNWDDTGRVASRHFLFHYNKANRAWRSEFGDWWGSDANNVTQHASNAWSCHFTDGEYANWVDKGDSKPDFGLLSWNQFNADCYLTIVD